VCNFHRLDYVIPTLKEMSDVSYATAFTGYNGGNHFNHNVFPPRCFFHAIEVSATSNEIGRTFPFFFLCFPLFVERSSTLENTSLFPCGGRVKSSFLDDELPPFQLTPFRRRFLLKILQGFRFLLYSLYTDKGQF